MATDIKFVQLDLDPNKHPLFSTHTDYEEWLEKFNSTVKELSVCYKHNLLLGAVILCSKVIESLFVMAYEHVFRTFPTKLDRDGSVVKDSSGYEVPMPLAEIRRKLSDQGHEILDSTQDKYLKLIQNHRNIAVHGTLKFPTDTEADVVVTGTMVLVEQVICHFCSDETPEDLITRGKVRANFGNHDEAIKDFDSAIQVNRNLAEAYYNRGISRAALGKNEDAIKDFTRAIGLNWNLAANHFNRGKAHENDDRDKALEDFDTAVNRGGHKYPEAYYRRGLLRVYRGEYQEAIRDFDKAIKLKEYFSEANYSRAGVKYRLEDFDSALTDLDEAIRLNPDNADAYRIRGLIKRELELEQLAVVDFDEVLRRNPSDTEARAQRGHARIECGQYVPATADFNDVLDQDPDNVKAYVGLARVNILTEDFGTARRYINDLLRLDSTNAMGNFFDGYLKEEDGKHKSAIEAYSIAIDNNLTRTYESKAYNHRGGLYEMLKEHDKAIADYTKAIEAKPDFYLPYRNQGSVHSNMGRNNDAIQDYSNAIRLNPDDDVSYARRGEVKELVGDNRGAIEDCDKAIELDSKDAHSYHVRGLAKIGLGDYRGVIEDYSKAIELDPKDAHSYYVRGLAKKALKDYDGAIEDYYKATELDPENLGYYTARMRAKIAKFFRGASR